MQFSPSHLRAPKTALRRPKPLPVFGVGWRAFVNWPQPGGSPLSPVPMTDAAGTPMTSDLADGQEVEIVSWRPRAREGVAYQVRRCADGSEWWIGAQYLRRLRQAQPAMVSVA